MTSQEKQGESELDAGQHSAGSSGRASLLFRLSHKIGSPSQSSSDAESSAITSTALLEYPNVPASEVKLGVMDSVPGLGLSETKVKEEEPTPTLLQQPFPPPADDETSISSSSRSVSPDVEIRPPTQQSKTLDVGKASPFTSEELQEAKNIVLDLLGWGVSPEYFLTAGISPETIYRIFTDLNLRLPANFEFTEDIKASAYEWGPSANTPAVK